MGLNIRIIKTDDVSIVKRLLLKPPVVFFITDGYNDTIDSCTKRMVVEYCPFCGKQLNKCYGIDYAQETW